MWCVVKVNQVIKIIPGAQNVVVNDVQHPAAIFRSWTATELANIGVFPYSETPRDTKHHVYRGERFDIKSDEVVKVWDNVTDRPLADVKAEYTDITGFGFITFGFSSNYFFRICHSYFFVSY